MMTITDHPRVQRSRRFVRSLGLTALALAGLAPGARAQNPPLNLAQKVTIEQKLDAQIPMDAPFRDEEGRSIALGDLLGDKPAVLALVYYECPMLCGMILNGLLETVRALAFDAGQEFDIIVVSFDPDETPALAKAKKEAYVNRYARPGTEDGWHFLTGEAGPIERLTDAVGFRYIYDPETDEFAHASAIMVLTPQGHISKYYYGVEYSARDLRLGLVDAANGDIGSLADAVLLWCYHYDPVTGRYGFAILNTIRVFGAITVAAIVASIVAMIRHDRRKRTPT